MLCSHCVLPQPLLLPSVQGIRRRVQRPEWQVGGYWLLPDPATLVRKELERMFAGENYPFTKWRVQFKGHQWHQGHHVSRPWRWFRSQYNLQWEFFARKVLFPEHCLFCKGDPSGWRRCQCGIPKLWFSESYIEGNGVIGLRRSNPFRMYSKR